MFFLFIYLVSFARSDIPYYLFIFVDISGGLEAGARTLGGLVAEGDNGSGDKYYSSIGHCILYVQCSALYKYSAVK